MLQNQQNSEISGQSPPFKCPVCGSAFEPNPIAQETIESGTLGIVACSGCSFHVTWPRLDAPQSHYTEMTEEAWQKKYGEIASGAKKHDRHENYLEETAVISRYLEQGSILDIGCNAGWLLGYLKTTGKYTLEGLEPSPVLAEICRRHVGVTVHQMFIQEFARTGQTYNALTATDVIEHVPPEHLPQFLEACRTVLKPGGFCFIKTPNFSFTLMKHKLSALIPARLRKKIIHASDVFDAKEHVSLFDSASLRTIFEKSNFAIVACFVPKPVQTRDSPILARLTRSFIYRVAKLAGGTFRVPFFAQDILIISQRR